MSDKIYYILQDEHFNIINDLLANVEEKNLFLQKFTGIELDTACEIHR